MPKSSDSKFLPYSAQQMYDLVADIGRYPEFIPWCDAARIRSRRQEGQKEIIEADLTAAFKVFRERFGSRVILDPKAMQIDTAYLDGPFKYLNGTWQFEDAEGGCQVSFAVDFEFRNFVLQKMIGLVFAEAMQRIIKAFEARAHALYGEEG